MALILPPVESFGTQIAKQLGSNVGQGIGNTPNLLMDLLKQKRERENYFGTNAVELSKQSGRNPTLEEQAKIYEDASKLAGENKSPVEIQKSLIGQEVKRANERSRIEENIDPERLWKKFTGETKEDRIRKNYKLKKQLEKSSFDNKQKREILSSKMQPEEIEEILNPLSSETSEFLKTFPSLKPTLGKFSLKKKADLLETNELTDSQREFFKRHLQETFQKDPNVNPLLLRKHFEDKGVSWREYRDAIEQLQEEGSIDLSNNQDYAQLEKYLYKPPLGPLDHLLNDFKIIGR